MYISVKSKGDENIFHVRNILHMFSVCEWDWYCMNFLKSEEKKAQTVTRPIINSGFENFLYPA